MITLINAIRATLSIGFTLLGATLEALSIGCDAF